MNEWKQVRRDPFGRFDVIRRTAEDTKGSGCTWCGRKRKGGKLFQYGTWHDGGRKDPGDGRLFCSLGCCETYHGG
jgi:hypothetical protein